jgi:hypothetical protein
MKRVLAAGLALAASTLALGQEAPAMPKFTLDQFRAIADDVCLKSVVTPPPFGEGDLKGDPQLPAYCKCFSDKFGERAYKLSQGLMVHQPPMESLAGQRAMRNTCRAQLGLQQIAFKP